MMTVLNTSEVEPAGNYIIVDLNGAGESLLISNTENPKFYEIEESVDGEVVKTGFYVKLAHQPDICFDSCKKSERLLSFAPINSFVPGATFKFSTAKMSETIVTEVAYMGQPV